MLAGRRSGLAEGGVAANASELIIESTSVDIVLIEILHLARCLQIREPKELNKKSRWDAKSWRDTAL